MNLYTDRHTDTQIFSSHQGDMKAPLYFEHLPAFLSHAVYFSCKASVNKHFTNIFLDDVRK